MWGPLALNNARQRPNYPRKAKRVSTRACLTYTLASFGMPRPLVACCPASRKVSGDWTSTIPAIPDSSIWSASHPHGDCSDFVTKEEVEDSLFVCSCTLEQKVMPSRDVYLKPQIRSRTFEQGALFLTGQAWIGNQEAKELLELLFPEPRVGFENAGPGDCTSSPGKGKTL
jgi:hypothetical protein